VTTVSGSPRTRASWAITDGLMRHPARLVALGFAVAVVAGTVLLFLPAASAGPGGASFSTALFTAASAVTVTGLVVVDTGTYWSGFGQAVMIVLMQVGGIGIMTMASLLGLVVARRRGLRSRMLVQAETRAVDLGTVRNLLGGVLVLSVTLELFAWVAITLRLFFGYGESFGTALYHGLFHAVSAFNSGGFALYPDSLTRFAEDVWVLLPVTLAFMLGALGYPVLLEVRRVRRPREWSVHTKLTLITFGVIAFLGPAIVLLGEQANPETLGDLGPHGKVVAAVFSGLSAGSAGFNVIDYAHADSATLFATDALMFIGGGSGGTAGGIKVTTVAVLTLAVIAEIRGDDDVEVFGRRLAPATVRQALTVTMIALVVVTLSAFWLLRFTAGDLDHALFEVVSAFSNSGLSTGITPTLPDSARYLLVVLMYVGRVGPLTAATALALRSSRRLYRYPETRPLVG
jgi:Trk-type K+ transport system membrane component